MNNSIYNWLKWPTLFHFLSDFCRLYFPGLQESLLDQSAACYEHHSSLGGFFLRVKGLVCEDRSGWNFIPKKYPCETKRAGGFRGVTKNPITGERFWSKKNQVSIRKVRSYQQLNRKFGFFGLENLLSVDGNQKSGEKTQLSLVGYFFSEIIAEILGNKHPRWLAGFQPSTINSRNWISVLKKPDEVTLVVQ